MANGLFQIAMLDSSTEFKLTCKLCTEFLRFTEKDLYETVSLSYTLILEKNKRNKRLSGDTLFGDRTDRTLTE